MRFLAVVLFMALNSFPCLAQDSTQYRTCNESAKTQAEMNACANEEAARVDAELNDAYRKLLSKAAGQPESVAKIKVAQRAWIAYRDAYTDAMYPAKDKQAEYGSIYPMEIALLSAKLTQQQVAALRELLQQYSGAEHSGAAVESKPNDQSQPTSKKPITVMVKKTKGRVSYEVESKAVRELLWPLGELLEQRGEECPVIVILPWDATFREESDVNVIASMAGFKTVRSFLYNRDKGFMAEVKWGLSIPFTKNPPLN
jgi:uncharacterized protein YecT (DUF1311 family)